MIIKRKYFTRQETKAMKEIYQALKDGKIGRNLSAKKFVKARHMSNETIDALTGKGKVADYKENESILKDLGLPETSKAYKRMIEKYNNPELHTRFKRIQQNSSNSRLKTARKLKKQIKDKLDELEKSKDSNLLLSMLYNSYSKAYETAKENAKNIKLERGSGKKYRFNRKELKAIAEKDVDDLYNRFSNIKSLLGRENTNVDSEMSQKIMKDLKRKGVKISQDSGKPTEYNSGKINFGSNKGDKRDPATILHEYGHLLSDQRKETRLNYYGKAKNLDENLNTSENLKNSINNRVKDLATLTEEANASYHSAARGRNYGITKEKSKSNKKRLDNSFRTYELTRAQNMLGDEYFRTIGKKKNK